MSKKKKKKSRFDYYYDFDKKSKKGKKGKKGKKKVGSTLSKNDLKRGLKEIKKTAVLPKLEENKHKCNHAKSNKWFTPEAFRTYLADNFGKMGTAVILEPIETAVALFGEDNVRVCNFCYEPMVDDSAIDNIDIDETLTVLRAMKNLAVLKEKGKKVELANNAFVKIEKQILEIAKSYRKKLKNSGKDDNRSNSKKSSATDIYQQT